MKTYQYLTIIGSIIGLFALLFIPSFAHADDHELEVNADPYFRGAWTVGMQADWNTIEDADRYFVLHFHKDRGGKALTRVGVPVSNVRFEVEKNESAPSGCMYNWIEVRAQNEEGEVIAKDTDNFCHRGFPVDSDEPAGLYDTKADMVRTLAYASRVLRSLYQQTLEQ